MQTLYMVEMDMPHPERLVQWHAWYEEHVRHLLARPGFRSAQRFRSVAPDASPYLAIYELEDETALTRPGYAGPAAAAAWAPFMNNWRRNLFSGSIAIDAVAANGWLALCDRVAEDAPAIPPDYNRLQTRGLDRSVVERGLCSGVGARPQAMQAAGCAVRVFTPISPMRVASGIQP